MMGGHEASPIRTINALEAVHALLKPYQYFHQPHAVREQAPAELEGIVTSLLTPLLPVVHLLVASTASSVAAGGVAPHDALLHTLCKCLHHTVRSLMIICSRFQSRKSPLRPCVAWCEGETSIKTLNYTEGIPRADRRGLPCRFNPETMPSRCPGPDPNPTLRFFHQVRSYMPESLLPTLPQWVDAVCRVLESVAQRPLTASLQLPAARAAKRALQICLTLVTRHRPHVRLPPVHPYCWAARCVQHLVCHVTAAVA
jgi:hypothetical protein